MSFLSQNASTILTLTIEHLWLTGAAMFFAALIAIPAGILLARRGVLACRLARAHRVELRVRRPGRGCDPRTADVVQAGGAGGRFDEISHESPFAWHGPGAPRP